MEDIHKTSLLGMAVAWNIKYAKEKDIYNHAQHAEMKRWLKNAKGIQFTECDKSKSKEGVDKLKYRVENLKWF